jgi:hypothetical protein
MITKHKFGVFKFTKTISWNEFNIPITAEPTETPENLDEVVLYIDDSNNLMLTTLDYNNNKETLLKGMLEQL